MVEADNPVRLMDDSSFKCFEMFFEVVETVTKNLLFTAKLMYFPFKLSCYHITYQVHVSEFIFGYPILSIENKTSYTRFFIYKKPFYKKPRAAEAKKLRN